MKKREGYRVIISKEAKDRIAKGRCPSCGKHKSKWKRRKDWRCCSVECTKEFEKNKITRYWPDLREKVFEMDNFTCVKCGKKQPAHYEWNIPKILIADHIVPIALGGEEWGINNIQTLCEDCNKIKTREDQKKIAYQRAIEKKLVKGQKKLNS